MSQVTDYLARIGAKGGKATGASKRRGDAAHYKRLSRKAAKARKAKSHNEEAHLPAPGGEVERKKDNQT